MKKFECYVHGAHVDIFMDHYGLQHTKKNNLPAQIQCWWWDIANYDFDTYCKKGETNIADPQSRLMPQSEFDFEDGMKMKLLNKIDAEVGKHAKVVEI